MNEYAENGKFAIDAFASIRSTLPDCKMIEIGEVAIAMVQGGSKNDGASKRSYCGSNWVAKSSTCLVGFATRCYKILSPFPFSRIVLQPMHHFG